jgi:hypothetical protein
MTTHHGRQQKRKTPTEKLQIIKHESLNLSRDSLLFFDENFILSAFYIKNLFACLFDKLYKKKFARNFEKKKRFILILPHRRRFTAKKTEKKRRKVMRRLWFNKEQKTTFQVARNCRSSKKGKRRRT